MIHDNTSEAEGPRASGYWLPGDNFGPSADRFGEENRIRKKFVHYFQCKSHLTLL
jgi:hypothetical protein